MTLATMHREDVKAAIRKKYPSVAAFERAHDLPSKSVSDLFRGQKSERVERAVLSVIEASQSEGSDPNTEVPNAHRLNTQAR